LKLSNKSIDRDDLVLVGRVTGAHGIRGGLKIQAYSESPTLFPAGKEILLSPPDGSIRTLTIEWVRPHGHGICAGFESIKDRNQAEGLIGSLLFIDKARLPELEEDTYYWFELMGLRVYDTHGSLLGVLDAVIPTGANDVYVIKGEAYGQSREMLLPAIGDVVIDIDLGRKRMIVDPPQGL
jgi:16S rRNA processing protein RimM